MSAVAFLIDNSKTVYDNLLYSYQHCHIILYMHTLGN